MMEWKPFFMWLTEKSIVDKGVPFGARFFVPELAMTNHCPGADPATCTKRGREIGESLCNLTIDF